jgi:hypothetical protein
VQIAVYRKPGQPRILHRATERFGGYTTNCGYRVARYDATVNPRGKHEDFYHCKRCYRPAATQEEQP